MELTTAAGKRWKIYGSPATPRFVAGSFQYTTREEAEVIYNRIPLDTEILLTHTPPHLILDKPRRGPNAGCKYLATKLDDLKSCKLHVFGHIHEAHGAMIHKSRRNGGHANKVSVNGALAWGGQAVIVDLRDF